MDVSIKQRYDKILCEIKKIESENNRYVERGFPNSGCLCC